VAEQHTDEPFGELIRIDFFGRAKSEIVDQGVVQAPSFD